MTYVNPHSAEAPKTASDDPRVGQLIGRKCTPETAEVVIVGFPSDEGVRINGGRAGASDGPAEIRTALYKMTPDARAPEQFIEVLRHTFDLGDVNVSGDVARDQEVLGRVLQPHLERGAVPIILGGGHETAFGHFLGHAFAGNRVEIINWDAHPDVRPVKDGRAHSGSPFRQAMTHDSDACRRYSVLGLTPHQTAAAHVEFIASQGGSIVWGSELTEDVVRATAEAAQDPTMVSFDLDAVDQSEAPGVSASCIAGLTSTLWLRAAYECARSPAAASFDVVELNPRFDVDGRTARLAALTVWMILRGLADRIGIG